MLAVTLVTSLAPLLLAGVRALDRRTSDGLFVALQAPDVPVDTLEAGIALSADVGSHCRTG
jgi:hypothetical protein